MHICRPQRGCEQGVGEYSALVNAKGAAIALGHPLYATGTRLASRVVNQLQRIKWRCALCTMWIGAGQAIAMVIERVRGTGTCFECRPCIPEGTPNRLWRPFAV